jgi:hypothetical protein
MVRASEPGNFNLAILYAAIELRIIVPTTVPVTRIRVFGRVTEKLPLTHASEKLDQFNVEGKPNGFLPKSAEFFNALKHNMRSGPPAKIKTINKII